MASGWGGYGEGLRTSMLNANPLDSSRFTSSRQLGSKPRPCLGDIFLYNIYRGVCVNMCAFTYLLYDLLLTTYTCIDIYIYIYIYGLVCIQVSAPECQLARFLAGLTGLLRRLRQLRRRLRLVAGLKLAGATLLALRCGVSGAFRGR